MNFFASIYPFDIQILHLFNVDWSSPALDQFWLTITHLERVEWFIFGVLPAILVALLYIYRVTALKLLLVLGVTVGISDFLAYRVVKATVVRPRPFQNAEISSWVRKVGDAHGPSFPSNHAANCFAGAVILAWYFKRKGYYFYIFATLVAISRVALGVHYPSDVVAGAMLGFLVGFLVRIFVLNRYFWFWPQSPVSRSNEDSSNWRTRIRRLDDV